LSKKVGKATMRYHSTGFDEFAHAFLAFLSDPIYIETGVKLESMSVKVLWCTDRFWSHLWEKRATTVDGSPDEYPREKTVEDWWKADGYKATLAFGTDRITGEKILIPQEDRPKVPFLREFPVDLARELAAYDALIFLRTSGFKGPSTPHPTNNEELTDAIYPFEIIAHECLHIVQDLTGTNMEAWNPESGQSDPVTQPFFRFIDHMTTDGFVARYLRHTDRDEIDL